MISQATIDAAVAYWDEMIQDAGMTAQFVLHDGGTFSINVARRKKKPEDVSAGIQQKGFEIQFMGFRWSTNSARHPEKGDQVTIEGRRHAIESVTPHSIGNTLVGYVARVMG